jgi:ABC-type transport system involved in Fe-S cluster assembly fused permease/ATPase subunit
MPETSMNTAFPCRCESLLICPYSFALGNGMEEVVGSIPTRSTIFSITYKFPDQSVGSIW